MNRIAGTSHALGMNGRAEMMDDQDGILSAILQEHGVTQSEAMQRRIVQSIMLATLGRNPYTSA